MATCKMCGKKKTLFGKCKSHQCNYVGNMGVDGLEGFSKSKDGKKVLPGLKDGDIKLLKSGGIVGKLIDTMGPKPFETSNRNQRIAREIIREHARKELDRIISNSMPTPYLTAKEVDEYLPKNINLDINKALANTYHNVSGTERFTVYSKGVPSTDYSPGEVIQRYGDIKTTLHSITFSYTESDIWVVKVGYRNDLCDDILQVGTALEGSHSGEVNVGIGSGQAMVMRCNKTVHVGEPVYANDDGTVSSRPVGIKMDPSVNVYEHLRPKPEDVYGKKVPTTSAGAR